LEKGAISLSTVNMVGPKLTEANKDLLLGELAGKSTRETRLLLASVDAEGRRREGARMVDLRLSLSEEVLARWEHARSLVAKAKMKPLEEALTEIVDDFLARHDPVVKAQRARQRSHEKRSTGDCRAAGRSDATASAATDCRAAGRSDAAASAATDCRTAGRSDAAASAATDCRAAGRSDAAASAAADCRAAGRSDVVTGPVADGRTEGRRGAISPFAGHGTHGSRSRYVPAPVRHALWRRASGRCEAPDCGKTESLQIDHKKVLFCRGGEHDLDNLQLLCTACHKLKTTRELGREALERKVRERVEARYGLYYARGHYLPPIDG
jgi:5-methylcytosine-specific restriction endonuclease McrA